MTLINFNYKDITEAMFKNASPKSNNVTHAKNFITDNGEIFTVDNKKNGVLFQRNTKDYKDTKNCAKLLRKTFGGKIELQPVVKCKDNMQTCDLKWYRPTEKEFEKWDLKTIEGNSNSTLDNMIKNKKKQSNNFIFDIRNHTISKENAKKQIVHIFNNPHRNWINIIMLKDNDEIIFIYQKNEISPSKGRVTSHL